MTRPEGAVLRVQALGETTTEVEIDEPLGRSELATSTESTGASVAPARFEAGERVALRRAIECGRRSGSPRRTSDDLLHDAEAAAASSIRASASVVFS